MLRIKTHPGGHIVYLAAHSINAVRASPNGEVALISSTSGDYKAMHTPEQIVAAKTLSSRQPLAQIFDVETMSFIDLPLEKEVE